ncbi:MAG: hypothetical protein ACLQBB_06935 [Solirubrobacteraceae bacterium]
MPKKRVLDTYEAERRSSDELNAQRSLENAVNQFTIVAALGVSHEHSEAENLAHLRRMWSTRAEDREHRSTVLRHIRAQSMEFSELNVELGYSYESAAITHDKAPHPVPVDPIRVYEPSTRPGSPLPHAWLDDEDGERHPIKDLVKPGRFLLVAGEEGHDWCAAGAELAAGTDLPLDCLRIGHLDGDLFDPRCTWLRRREIGPDGAVLVRPDRYVAWRSTGAAADPTAELATALEQVLARPTEVAQQAARA